MAQILHFADLHLDTTFKSLATSGRVDHRPRQALRDCLRRIVDLALERQVDMVTIAGDLYEHGRRSADTLNFVRAELARLQPTPVVIAPGNHDPFTPESLYRVGEWPSNVAIAETPHLQPLATLGEVEIWGAAFTAQSRSDSPLQGFSPLPADGRKRLLLLHASTDEHDTQYCPICVDQIDLCGFDAALLGHIHNSDYSLLDKRVYYPGSPEPLNFSEEGPHYVLLLDTDDDALVAERVPINRMRFGTLRIDISDMGSNDQVQREIIRQARARGLLEGITRVYLEGDQHPDIDLDVAALRSSLRQSFTFFVDLIDETRAPYDLQTEAQGYNTKARFVRALLDRIHEEDNPDQRELYQEALVLGLRAFEGRELAPRQRVPRGDAQ